MQKLLLISLFFLALGVNAQAQTARPAVSISDQPKVRLFPNPATSFVQVDWNAQLKPATFVVVNGITGRQMLAGPINANSIRLNVSNYVTGLYVIRMFSANGTCIGGVTFQVTK